MRLGTLDVWVDWKGGMTDLIRMVVVSLQGLR